MTNHCSWEKKKVFFLYYIKPENIKGYLVEVNESLRVRAFHRAREREFF